MNLIRDNRLFRRKLKADSSLKKDCEVKNTHWRKLWRYWCHPKKLNTFKEEKNNAGD